MREYTAGEITKHVLEVLELRGIDCWRSNNLAVRGRKFIGRKGVCDVIGFHKRTGVFVGCEIKKTGDTLKPDQIVFLMALKASGGIALIAKQEKSEIVINEWDLTV